MKPSKKIADLAVDLNTLEDLPSSSAETGLKAETDLDYIFQQMSKHPPLKVEEEKLITRKIFDAKIQLLTSIAIQEPIFIYYLDLMIESPDIGDENEDEEFEDEENSPNFEHYLNSEKDSNGNNHRFSVFKKRILKLRDACVQILTIKSERKFNEQKLLISQMIEGLNFSWSKLEKDGFVSLISQDDPNYRVFRFYVNKMFNHNLRLSVSVAKHYFFLNSNHADLVQEANRGLLLSIQRFDPRRGYKFSTFAVRWIRQYVGRFASQFWTIRVPVHMYEKIADLKSRERKHPDWNEEQLAKDMECTVDYVRKLQLIRSQTQVTSLDEPINNDPSRDGADTLGSFIADADNDVEKAILDVITHDQMVKIMKERLTEREYEIMARRLGLEDHDEETLEQIGSFFQVSRERIRQLEKAAVIKLRSLKFFQQMRIAK